MFVVVCVVHCVVVFLLFAFSCFSLLASGLFRVACFLRVALFLRFAACCSLSAVWSLSFCFVAVIAVVVVIVVCGRGSGCHSGVGQHEGVPQTVWPSEIGFPNVPEQIRHPQQPTDLGTVLEALGASGIRICVFRFFFREWISLLDIFFSFFPGGRKRKWRP